MDGLERKYNTLEKRIFLFMLPEHGNIGDYAIGYATLQFFHDYFPLCTIYGVATGEWLNAKEKYTHKINEEDVICFNGGGYIGDLWGDDVIYKEMTECFPDNIKIFLPNTFTYRERPDENNVAFMRDMDWIRKQKNLYIFFRDDFSYEQYRKHRGEGDVFADMAFYLSFPRNDDLPKRKVLLCMRDDREKTFCKIDEVKETLNDSNIEFEEFDLYRKRYISQDEGKDVLEKTIELFQGVDCVFTDRLHGMILSTVSNVPCVAVDNYTHKIRGVYERTVRRKSVRLFEDGDITNFVLCMRMAIERKNSEGIYKRPMNEFNRLAAKIGNIITEN